MCPGGQHEDARGAAIDEVGTHPDVLCMVSLASVRDSELVFVDLERACFKKSSSLPNVCGGAFLERVGDA